MGAFHNVTFDIYTQAESLYGHHHHITRHGRL